LSLRERLERRFSFEIDDAPLCSARRRDLLALGLWLLPPWMVAGYFVYEWQIANADLTPLRLGLVAAAYALARFVSRVMQFNILRGMGVFRRDRSQT
jgi:hypothetical protein